MKSLKIDNHTVDFIFITLRTNFDEYSDWPEDVLCNVFGFKSRWLIKYSLFIAEVFKV